LDRELAVRRVRAVTAELDDSIRELRETIDALYPSRSVEAMPSGPVDRFNEPGRAPH
jgi:hypothetical protein